SKALTALALAGAVGLSLFASACGSSTGNGVAQIGSAQTTTSSSSSSRSRSPSDRRGALVAFSACMRKHGLPNFPHPQAVHGRHPPTLRTRERLRPDLPP